MPEKRTRVYIASPYTIGDVAVNVRNSILVADELVSLGYAPYVPLLKHFWHLIVPHEREFWMEQDRQWLVNCHALLRLPGESKGADAEVALANELHIPVVWSVGELTTECWC